MKTFSLRTLLRDPKSVKKLTRGGQVVRITDGGQPLWDLASPTLQGGAEDTKAEAERNRQWEAHFDDLLSQSLPTISLPSVDEVLDFSRGNR